MNKVFKSYFLLIIIAIGFFSCSSRHSDEIDFSELELIDSLEIMMPLGFLQMSKWQTYSENGKTYLIEYGLNRNGDLLIFKLDFNKGKYLEPLEIPNQGPDGFNSFGVSISYQGADSIYVFPASKEEFILYDSFGKKKREYPYNGEDRLRFYTSGVYSDISKSKEGLLIPTINDTRYDDPQYFEKVVPATFYDFEKQKFDIGIPYPDYLQGKYFPSNLTAAQVTYLKDDISIINYSFSDSLYLYNSNDNSISSIYCGIPNERGLNYLNSVPDRAKSLNYNAKEKNFEFSKYYNGKIYRLVSHLSEKRDRELNAYEIIAKNARGVTLIELDPDTKRIKYYKMPIARYFVFQGDKLFVGGVSMREDENQDVFKKFYIYSLK
ncbi:hypothetical protein [Algoriphagus machipongonensis]|uniref:Lipoprotein n=1 Tax=Algoriphagus machipongonensis TaxID=388413 RepID=A3HUY2_9BACT|nr:hypothetical protein [Algoriphagus machipongonensis]EAZ81954.1 hypothetical protein ALPR1_01895 [Algoriphagus machipongonensis]